MNRWTQIAGLIDRYGKVYTEASLSKSDQIYQQQFIVLSDPAERFKYMSRDRWAKMQETFLRYYKIDIDKMAHLRPLFILTAIHQSLLGQMHGSSLDQQIWDYAVANEKETYGIESAQEQVEILLNLPLQTQYRQLVKLSKRISGQQKKLKKLVQAYMDQDIVEMYRLSKQSMGLSRSLLLHDRNVIMTQRIMKWHQEEPSFFSFGAGPLGGLYGVLTQLKKAGGILHPVSLT